MRWNGVNSDDENSGEALDGDMSIGRVYRAQNRDAWQWSMYAMRHGVQRAGFAFDGEAATKEEGKRRVEEAYDELLRRAEAATAARKSGS
jgi:hypothetical protein